MQTKMWITLKYTTGLVDKSMYLSTKNSTRKQKLSTEGKGCSEVNNQTKAGKTPTNKQNVLFHKIFTGNRQPLKLEKGVSPKSTSSTPSTAFYIYNI